MSKLTSKMMDRITRILDFPLATYIAKELRDQGITAKDVYPHLDKGNWNEIYNALDDMEKRNLAHPRSLSYAIKPDDLPNIMDWKNED